MSDTTSPTPLFVHGTLRPGEPGFWRLERYVTAIETADLSEYALYIDTEPVIVRTGNTDDITTGDLVHLEPTAYDNLLSALDRLHSTRHQIRARITVQTRDGNTVTAWAYTAGRPIGQRIDSGDWTEYQP